MCAAVAAAASPFAQAGGAEEEERASRFMAVKSRKGALDYLKEVASAAASELVSIESIERACDWTTAPCSNDRMSATSTPRGRKGELNKKLCLVDHCRDVTVCEPAVRAAATSDMRGDGGSH